MKKALTILGLQLLLLSGAHAVIYNYDFGTSTGNFTSSGTSTTFLPATQSGGGSQYVRIGTQGGAWTLVNPSTLGAGSAGSNLNGTAATGTSRNKFSIYDFSDATSQFSLSFKLSLSGGSSGTWSLFAGNGATFSTPGSAYTGAETFLGLQFAFGASADITTSNRAGATWSTVTSDPIAQDTNYTIQIFANNTSGVLNYTNSGAQTIAANSYDLWVDGVLVGDNLAKAQLAEGSAIDSFMFYGENSTGNAAIIALDNITYATAIPEPATWVIVGICFGFVLLKKRRRIS